MKKFATALALALMLPVAVAAQEEQGHGQMQHPGMGHHAGMPGGMGMAGGMMMDHPGPGMLLRLRGTLALEPSQVERLEAMHAAARTSMQTHMEAAREARHRAHAAMQGATPDLAAHEKALREAADHTVQAQQGMARAHLEAAGVLTADQRQKLDTILAAMKEMHQSMGAMRQGEMEHGPMRPRDGMRREQ